ncbi:hypothetical protein ACFPM0_33595 [Pseudonocardia sulfidoxydans]|uniref:hypothetical protein n=1 Tax=Pseudonocardia sulfidoxydans TaxID=54011 RepID=UPI00361FC62A
MRRCAGPLRHRSQHRRGRLPATSAGPNGERSDVIRERGGRAAGRSTSPPPEVAPRGRTAATCYDACPTAPTRRPTVRDDRSWRRDVDPASDRRATRLH